MQRDDRRHDRNDRNASAGPLAGGLCLLLPLGLLGGPAAPGEAPPTALEALSLGSFTPSLVRTWTPDGGGDGWTTSRPDGHAPIGVMGDHTHHAGEWMFSYRFMRMDMDGNRSGTTRQTPQDVFDLGFPVAPVRMTMDMHMFGAMHATSDDLTLMAMVPYLDIEMDHVTAMGGAFTTESSGLGDVKLGALYRLREGDGHRLHLNAGLSVPTGSITQRDATPMSGGADVQLPYPMQLGSGTFDFLPGLTYLGQEEHWSWGAQGLLTVRLGTNDRDYRLGDRADVTGWVARELSETASISVRLSGARWCNIHGADPAPSVNPAVVPTADPDRRAGKRADLSVGLNLLGKRGALRGHRLAFEYGVPVYQDLDGPQLETDSIFTLGWQWAR